MKIHAGRIGLVVMLLLTILIALPQPVSQAQEDSQQRHIVQTGENLFRIALRYGITVDVLATANGITDPARIYAGQVLVIPGDEPVAPPAESEAPAAEPAVPEEVESAEAVPVYHVVQTGQNLYRIAEQYNIDVDSLVVWNEITDPNTILVGQKLVVGNTTGSDTPAVAGPTIVEEAAPAETDPVTSEPAPDVERTHVVQVGERLASIARIYGISWPTIARANDIQNPNQIFAGQRLLIPAEDDSQGTYLVPDGGVPSAPAPSISTGKSILVDLSDQKIFAYEDGRLLKQVTVSTGLPATPTVQGTYRVYWKLTSQTMSGPGYYLPGVPWVMYFYQGYAIHGTYWHNNFGQPMSHGCVNLPTPDAQWFFNWAEIGTPVTVQS